MATMIAAQRLLSADDLLTLPDDGASRYELVRGVLSTMPPPGMAHGACASNINELLRVAARAAGAGRVFTETGFLLRHDPDTVRGPDVAFVRASRLPPRDQWRGYFQGAPDIAVEIVSPGNTAAEIAEKVAEYLAAGARLVWVAHPVRLTVTVHRADGTITLLYETDTLTGEDVLPAFRARVADLFE